MRVAGMTALALGLAATLAACNGEGLDQRDTPVERAAAGLVLGGALGAGIGAAISINPAIGAAIGGASGALIGAAGGALSAQPGVGYRPIPPAAGAAIPRFYDSWPPGSHPPPVGMSVPPPIAGAS
jgi:hypothetical protein